MKIKLIFSLVFLSACASGPSENSQEAFVFESGESTSEAETIDMSIMLAQRRAIDRLNADGTKTPGLEISETAADSKDFEHKYLLNTKTNHPKVQKWIRYYTQKDRERFQRFLNRGARYKAIIQDLFVANGLPPDLYYLGILESGFVHGALSHAGAVGHWQFMAPTGREYGLKINNYVDERVDPIRSAMAASRYLKELFRQKKSWYLALASYNAGPGRVRRAMRRARRRGKAQNYWSLTRRRLLPYDTREYIPQFLAILYIGKNLEKFNFVESTNDPLPKMELVKTPAPVKFSDISKATGLTVDELKKLNPHLGKEITPPGYKTYPLWVSKRKVETLSSAFQNLAQYRVPGLKAKRSIARYRGKRTIHRVRRGQNLSAIARRYRLSLSQLKRMNNLRSNRIYVGQKLRVRSRAGQTRVSKRTAYHKVRRGQNLSAIARRYGMSTKELKRINSMRSSKILVGQKLKVYSKKSRRSARSVASNKKFHRVRRGDNLTVIARKYGTTVAQLKRANNLKTTKLYKGQKLKLKGVGSSRVKRYKIRRGDNLISIAKKFGLTLRQIKKLNGLKSNKIQKGQTLIVASK